jgi:hypothetical protein
VTTERHNSAQNDEPAGAWFPTSAHHGREPSRHERIPEIDHARRLYDVLSSYDTETRTVKSRDGAARTESRALPRSLGHFQRTADGSHPFAYRFFPDQTRTITRSVMATMTATDGRHHAPRDASRPFFLNQTIKRSVMATTSAHGQRRQKRTGRDTTGDAPPRCDQTRRGPRFDNPVTDRCPTGREVARTSRGIRRRSSEGAPPRR